MRVQISLDKHRYAVILDHPIEIAIPQLFDGSQPNAFGLQDATQQPAQAGRWRGDVLSGSPVNCRTVTTTPHANGTHTECVGHIVRDPVVAPVTLHQTLHAAVVLSVPLERLGDCGESYRGKQQPQDAVVTARGLRDSLAARGWLPPCSAVVVRTTPNPPAKARSRFTQDAPYLTSEAVSWLRRQGFLHLLIDLPSIDRLEDGGSVPNHRRWWDVPSGDRLEGAPSPRTITEWIFVPDDCIDGLYLLELGVAPWWSDAVPARPRLYPLRLLTAHEEL